MSAAVLLSGQYFLLGPAAADPTELVTELAVEEEQTLRVTKGPGYGAAGERMVYEFAEGARVRSVGGAGGVTWWPMETLRLPAHGVSGTTPLLAGASGEMG